MYEFFSSDTKSSYPFVCSFHQGEALLRSQRNQKRQATPKASSSAFSKRGPKGEPKKEQRAEMG